MENAYANLEGLSRLRRNQFSINEQSCLVLLRHLERYPRLGRMIRYALFFLVVRFIAYADEDFVLQIV